MRGRGAPPAEGAGGLFPRTSAKVLLCRSRKPFIRAREARERGKSARGAGLAAHAPARPPRARVAPGGLRNERSVILIRGHGRPPADSNRDRGSISALKALLSPTGRGCGAKMIEGQAPAGPGTEGGRTSSVPPPRRRRAAGPACAGLRGERASQTLYASPVVNSRGSERPGRPQTLRAAPRSGFEGFEAPIVHLIR